MIAVHLARQHSLRSRTNLNLAGNVISGSRMKWLIEFVEQNLDRDLSLEAMAQETGISALYLPRAFKAAIGQSPHKYVLSRRIERAQRSSA